MSEYPTDRDLYQHQMFKNFFEFTPTQILKMCSLIQKKVSLDEIYNDLMLEHNQENNNFTKQMSMQAQELEMDNKLVVKI